MVKGREKEKGWREAFDALPILLKLHASGRHWNWNCRGGDQRIPREEKSLLGVSWESLYHGEGRDDNQGGGRETEKPEGGRKVDIMWRRWSRALFQDLFPSRWKSYSYRRSSCRTRINPNQYSSSCFKSFLISGPLPCFLDFAALIYRLSVVTLKEDEKCEAARRQ